MRDAGANTRQAVVVGAQGVLGTWIARTLTAAGWEVTRAGRRHEDAPDFVHVDLAQGDAVEELCGRSAFVVNTAHHPDLHLERAVLRHGGVLLDLTELSTSVQRRLAAEVARPAGLVVTHTGVGGVAYLALAELLSAHPDADAAEYALTFSAAGSTGRAGGLFAHRALTGLSHHATAAIPFPEPFGRRRCLEVGGDFDGALRQAVVATPVRHFMYLHPPALNGLLRALNFARVIKALPRGLFTAGAGRAPEELSDEPVRDWVAVSRSGRRLAARVIAGEGYYAMTAGATLAFATALAERERGTGVKGIEEVVALAEVAPALARVGIAVDEVAVGSR